MCPACMLNKHKPLVLLAEDVACKVIYYDIRNSYSFFKLQSQTSHLGFGLKSRVLSTNTTVQKRLMLKESS